MTVRIRVVKPNAMAGEYAWYFFTHQQWQSPTQTAMGATLVVNGETPPA